MEKNIYKKPQIRVVVVSKDICEEGVLNETRVVTHTNGPDIWIRDNGTEQGLRDGGWSWAKKSLWDEEEQELLSEEE